MASIERSTTTIVRLFREAEKQIITELTTATDYRRSQLLRISANITEILENLEEDYQPTFLTELRRHYGDGFQKATRAMIAAGLDVSGTFDLIDTNAIQAIADDSFLEFGKSFTGAKTSTEKVLDIARRRTIQDIFGTGRITGETRRDISKRIEERLEKGVVGLVDKSGREWSFSSYAEMLTRTKMRETTNTGLTNRLTREGFNLVQVSNHNSKHKECAAWEGKVLSVVADGEYPTIEQATSSGIFHPNCKHRLLPYHPSLSSQTS